MRKRDDAHALVQHSLLVRVDGQGRAAARHEADDHCAVKAAPDLRQVVRILGELRAGYRAGSVADCQCMQQQPAACKALGLPCTKSCHGRTSGPGCTACKGRQSLWWRLLSTGLLCRGKGLVQA